MSVGAWSPQTSPWWRVGSSWPALWTAYLAGASMTSDGGKKNLKVFFVLTSVTKSCYLHARDLIFQSRGAKQNKGVNWLA